MDETWLYHYDLETKQQSMEWRHSGSPHPAPINSEFKNPLENISPRFLGSRQHPLHWLSSKGPNYQLKVLLISAGAIEDISKEKRRGEFTKGILFLHDNAPAHLALATQKKLTYLGFQFLDHPPYSPDLAPSDYHLFPGLEKKNNWKVAIFRTTRRSLLPRRPGWMDKFSEFFWVVCQS